MLKLLHGDCLELMKDIPDKSIDAIITDPPYGTTACKWDAVIPFEPMWKELNRIIKDNGAIVLFGSQPFTSALIMSNPKMFKYCWIWDKVNPSGFQLAKHQPLRQSEDVMIFCKNKVNYFPIKTKREKIKISKHYGNSSESNPLSKVDDGFLRSYDEYYPKSILKFSNANRNNRLHPTQKPVELIEYLVKTYTNENETILDFTMGSGTTGVACKNLNRNFIGIEKDDNYFKIASDRINA
jgi:site-specific DNA-methyltransferase (adenine-specific)